MTKRKTNGVSTQDFYEALLKQNEDRAAMELRLTTHIDDKLDGFVNNQIRRLDGRVDGLQKESRVAAGVTAMGALLLGALGIRYPGQ
jgi:hypothetical protein